MSSSEELARLAHGLRAEIVRRVSLGAVGTARPKGPAAEPRPASRPAARGGARPVTAGDAPPTRAVARGAADLERLRACVASCTACALSRTRTQTVFADGPSEPAADSDRTQVARVMFVGEAPGQHEDEQGVPFVGRAGALLTDIIEKGMGLSRREVVIANVLKCRPPGNRDPEPEEKALCAPFLDRQIELVAPEVLITLGRHAAHHVLKSAASMGKLRGRVHIVGGRKVVATYHPAFLLRSPQMKKECWKDVQLAMAELGLERPGG